MISEFKEDSIMKIGIIGAMEEEISLLKKVIKKRKHGLIADFEYFTGELEQHKIVVLKSGIGKVNAATSATIMNYKFKCDYIINIGSAAGLGKGISVGDVVIASESCYHDVNIVGFGYKHGQVPRMPECYVSDAFLMRLAENCTQYVENHQTFAGLIVSGDAFMNDPENVTSIKKHFPNAIASEMESCSIAQVCYRLKIPFINIRSISDIAGENAHINYKKFLDLASTNSVNFILLMLRNWDKQGFKGKLNE